MRRVADKVVGEGWEVVCLMKIGAECEVMVWLGEEKDRVVLIHGRKSGVLLWSEVLTKWVAEEQRHIKSGQMRE